MNSSFFFSSISLSLIRKRSRSNNNAAAVEGAGAAATAAAAAATALAAIEDWKLKLQGSLARRVWESQLMEGHRAVFNRLFAAELGHAEALGELRLTMVSLAGLNVAICVTILLRRVQATVGCLDWSRLCGSMACIAALVFFRFLSRRRR